MARDLTAMVDDYELTGWCESDWWDEVDSELNALDELFEEVCYA